MRGKTLSGVTNFLIILDCLSKCDCYATNSLKGGKAALVGEYNREI